MARALPEFERLPRLVEDGLLETDDLEAEEFAAYADLRSAAYVRRFGLVLGLGPGEAAVLALCAGRGWRPATDDSDAIRVAAHLLPAVKVVRIRALLRLAVDRGLVDLSHAPAIHEQMRQLGFWDVGQL